LGPLPDWQIVTRHAASYDTLLGTGMPNQTRAAQAERQAAYTPTYAIRGQWTATGTVGHWGHVHTRRNQYDAIVTVRADQGGWKIAGLELLEEQRIDPAARTTTAER
jgi:hypothetical protein